MLKLEENVISSCDGLEAVGKGSTTVVPRKLKSGREAIDECGHGWIASFTRRGSRQS